MSLQYLYHKKVYFYVHISINLKSLTEPTYAILLAAVLIAGGAGLAAMK